MSKVKNIIVTKFYTVKDHSKWYSDRTAEAENTPMIPAYQEMINLLEASAKTFCVGLDEFRCHTGEVTDIRDAFEQDFFKIKELWESEPCNILYMDADTIFTRPTEIFGKFDEFRMFNYTDPRSLKTTEHDFEHYFNCGVRYYPHNMHKSVWDIGVAGFTDMDRTHWDQEQRIYNQMMWSQDINIMNTLYPMLAYQMISGEIFSESDMEFNSMPLQQAHIVHLHGSRNAAHRARLQAELAHMSTDTRIITWMRFEYLKGRGSKETYQVDKQFKGVDQEDLQHQIKYFMLKTGVHKAYNLEIKQ